MVLRKHKEEEFVSIAENKDRPYILGQSLLKAGFKVWFAYVFKLIEGNSFIFEEMHDDMFNFFEGIHRMDIKRGVINIPPRSAKTTMCIYFIAYCLAINPKCKFIYTSYSHQLVRENSRLLVNILTNDKFLMMFPCDCIEEEEEDEAIDEFWEQFADKINDKGKPVFTNNKIVNSMGGVVLFASMGSAITGFGAGLRDARKFTGGVIIDDANKPAEIRSAKIRSNIENFYTETLMSRLNNSNVFILNVQQRLHKKDLTGFLLENYSEDYVLLKKPLIENGKCLLPSQYTEKRLKELQVNNKAWKAQYQQSPIIDGGQIIHVEWFNYYKILPQCEYRIITADTAQKTKEHNDYSVFQCWGYGKDKNFYLIDQIRGKWEAPELRKQCKSFFNKHSSIQTWESRKYGALRCIYVEDKVSGTGLIQDIKYQDRLPIKGIGRTTDKLTRVNDAIPYIEFGYVYLPENAPWLSDYKTECEDFTDNNSHDNDDQIDPTCDAISILKESKSKSSEEINEIFSE